MSTFKSNAHQLDNFMSKGWKTKIPCNDNDDEDHRPILIELCGKIDVVIDSNSDEETSILPKRKRKGNP